MISPGEPSRSGLPPTIGWVGPGLTAFVGSAGESRIGRALSVEGMEGFGKTFGKGGDAEFHLALQAYFAAGGGPCLVLNLPPPASFPPESRAARWMGEDGGPGYRSGVFSLLDREEVGTIAAPGLRDPGLRHRLMGLQEKWVGCFIVLDAPPEGVAEDLPLSDRGALAPNRTTGSEVSRVPPSAIFLAELEASDFRVERPQQALRALAGGGHPTLGSRFPSAEVWRIWEGLRRSVDHGTRWVVFEPNREFLWRRVEREVRAFLERLHQLGLLEGRTPQDAFRVRCHPPAGERASEGLLVLDIEVKLKGTRRRSEVRLTPAGGDED